MRACLLAICSALTTACSDVGLDLEEKLVVAMYGVFVAPPDAMGNSEPKYQIYALQDLALVGADGQTMTALYAADEPTTVRIIDRSQIIYEADVSDYVDTEFSGISAQFASEVKGGAETGSELTAELPAPTMTLSQVFKFTKGKTNRLSIRVQWKNTVNLDETGETPVETMSAPTFAIDLKAD